MKSRIGFLLVALFSVASSAWPMMVPGPKPIVENPGDNAACVVERDKVRTPMVYNTSVKAYEATVAGTDLMVVAHQIGGDVLAMARIFIGSSQLVDSGYFPLKAGESTLLLTHMELLSATQVICTLK